MLMEKQSDKQTAKTGDWQTNLESEQTRLTREKRLHDGEPANHVNETKEMAPDPREQVSCPQRDEKAVTQGTPGRFMWIPTQKTRRTAEQIASQEQRSQSPQDQATTREDGPQKKEDEYLQHAPKHQQVAIFERSDQ